MRPAAAAQAVAAGRRAWLPLALLWLAGCGLNVQKNYAQMRPQLLAHDYDRAAAYLDSVKESFYHQDNRLLYYMDKGMVLHLAGRYVDSNVSLERAKVAAAELWTESVGANAAAWVTTDNSLPYQGEDFEKVLLHVVAALNHIGLGAYSDARVEARQVGQRLALLNAHYGAHDNAYRDDAFARWLAGRLAETDDEPAALGDAWIDYRRALEVYEQDYASRYRTAPPALLVANALRTLQRLGPEFAADHAALAARYPQVAPAPAPAPATGTVVFLHLNGEAPYKVDRFWEAQVGPNLLRIAHPEFVSKPRAIVQARLRPVGSPTAALTQKMEDIDAIAAQNLRDHMGRIQGKAVARAVAKFAAGAAAEAVGTRKGGEAGAAIAVAGALWNIGNAVAEEADKRSWITLPAEVAAAELVVPAGKVALDVEFLGMAGEVLEHARIDAQVAAGQTSFVSYRTFR